MLQKISVLHVKAHIKLINPQQYCLPNKQARMNHISHCHTLEREIVTFVLGTHYMQKKKRQVNRLFTTYIMYSILSGHFPLISIGHQNSFLFSGLNIIHFIRSSNTIHYNISSQSANGTMTLLSFCFHFSSSADVLHLIRADIHVLDQETLTTHISLSALLVSLLTIACHVFCTSQNIRDDFSIKIPFSSVQHFASIVYTNLSILVFCFLQFSIMLPLLIPT